MSSQLTSDAEPTCNKTELNTKISIGHSILNKPKTDNKGRFYREVRCINCRSWLCDEYLFSGRLKLKCFRCGTVLSLEFKHTKNVVPNEGRAN